MDINTKIMEDEDNENMGGEEQAQVDDSRGLLVKN